MALALASCDSYDPVPEPVTTTRALQPIEQIAHAQESDWSNTVTRQVPVDGTPFAVVRVSEENKCKGFVSQGTVSVFLPYTVDLPSFSGGKTGTFYEWLVPLNKATCALSPYRMVEWSKATPPGLYEVGVDGDTASVTIERIEQVPQPLELLIGATNSYLWTGHCGGYCNMEVELGEKYNASLRAHGLTVFDSHVTVPGIAPDGGLAIDSGGAFSFRNRVLRFSPGLVNVPRRDSEDPVQFRAYYKAVEKTIQSLGLQGRAWLYLRDEPGLSEYPSIAAKAKLIKEDAPSLLIMITAVKHPTLDPVIDAYSPVWNWLGLAGHPGPGAYAGKRLWPYVSCMGSCGPNRAWVPNAAKVSGVDTGLPDMLLDRPSHFITKWISDLREMGAPAALYYHMAEGYRLVNRVDLSQDAWNFGGHGDGLLYLPGKPGSYGLLEHTPLPGWRAKVLRAALEGVL